ncbi:MAG: hypothetical protein ACUVXD_12610 [Thermodesulfobacteriota bacterium]
MSCHCGDYVSNVGRCLRVELADLLIGGKILMVVNGVNPCTTERL